MADTTKSTQEQKPSTGATSSTGSTTGTTGTSGGGSSSPSTTPNRTSTAAGQSGYSSGTTGQGGSQGNQGTTGSATQRAQSSSGGESYGHESGQGSTQEMMDQAKQTLSDAYDRTAKGVNQTYQQAMDYGRENPGTMTLIAFGAGVAVGLLIAGGVGSSRSRTSRIVPPVMNALSDIAQELFR
jgi:ElaB/YqjD/DUF883 family membrane-anchored ribosome-binding protein